MRVSVRAGEVREGDRLIVPDENGREKEIVVEEGHPFGSTIMCAVWLSPGVLRNVGELVVVERPDPPITITVELTAEQAKRYRARAIANAAHCEAERLIGDAIYDTQSNEGIRNDAVW